MLQERLFFGTRFALGNLGLLFQRYIMNIVFMVVDQLILDVRQKFLRMMQNY